MKKSIIICICTIIIASGCSGKTRSVHSDDNEPCLYSVIIEWETPGEIYDWKISGWGTMVMASGMTDFVTVPVPDSVTFTWKTALPGGKEYYENLDGVTGSNEAMGFIPSGVNLYPSDLFQNHTTTFILKDKIPRNFRGKVFLTVKGEDNIVLRYIENQKMGEDDAKYKPMDDYRIFIVNNQPPGTDLYDFEGTGWPLYSFYSLPVKAGHIGKGLPYTVPPKKTTLMWKTALPGGEEYYDNFDKLISEPGETYEFERYPSDKFQEHRVTVEIDSDKIVEYGFGAQLIFYIYDGDKVEVEYRARGE